jgi:polyisoprenoid-binding protein YceI
MPRKVDARGAAADVSADFFDVENHPKITFSGRVTERTAGTAFKGRSG